METETDLLDHADKYGNFSVYIKNLIKKDMNNGSGERTATEQKTLEPDMIKMLMNMLGNTQLKDNIQKIQESSVDVVQPKEAVEKPKLNMGAIGNFIKK